MYKSGAMRAFETAYEEDRALGQRSFHVRRGIDIIADTVAQAHDGPPCIRRSSSPYLGVSAADVEATKLVLNEFPQNSASLENFA